MGGEEIEAKLQNNDTAENEKLEEELDKIEEDLLQIEVGTQPEDLDKSADEEDGGLFFLTRRSQ